MFCLLSCFEQEEISHIPFDQKKVPFSYEAQIDGYGQQFDPLTQKIFKILGYKHDWDKTTNR